MLRYFALSLTVPFTVCGIFLAVAVSSTRTTMEIVSTALALIFAITTFGLATASRTFNLAAPPVILTFTSGCWFLFALCQLWLQSSEKANASPFQLTLNQLQQIPKADLVPPICAAIGLLLCLGTFSPLGKYRRQEIFHDAVAFLCLTAIIIGPIGGHFRNVFSLALTAHIVAVAWWIGSVSALLLLVRGRKGWATALPLFSKQALRAVAVIVCSGTILVFEQSQAALWSYHYGQIVLLKIFLLLLLLGVTAWYRRYRLSKALRHQLNDANALRPLIIEFSLMILIIGAAAQLSATAPY